MCRLNLIHPANKMIAFFLTAILCTSAASAPRSAAISFIAQTGLKTYLVTPSQGRAGKDYDVLIMSDDPNCGTNHELAKAKVLAPEGTSVTVLSTTASDCSIAAR